MVLLTYHCKLFPELKKIQISLNVALSQNGFYVCEMGSFGAGLPIETVTKTHGMSSLWASARILRPTTEGEHAEYRRPFWKASLNSREVSIQIRHWDQVCCDTAVEGLSRNSAKFGLGIFENVCVQVCEKRHSAQTCSHANQPGPISTLFPQLVN